MTLNITTRLWLPTYVLGSMLAVLAVVGTVHTARQVEQDNQVQATLMQRLEDATTWQGLTSANAVRTMALAISTDPALAAGLKPELAETSARITTLGERLQASATDAESQASLARVAQARQTYLDARGRSQAALAAGDAALAQRLLKEQMAPALKAYQASQQGFVAVQHQQADAQRQAMGEQRRQAVWMMVGVAALMVLGLALGSQLLARAISRPLRQLAEVARRIGDGDLDTQVDTYRADEIGELQRSLAGMRDALRRIVGQVRESADSIRVASMEVATGNADLSQRTEHTASSLQHSAGSIAQLTVNVRQSAESAAQANQLANSASAVARQGGAVVNEVVATMQEIHTASQRIADIIGTIDGIAFQTNILALNAAVEAARAGEQGRGFAVVAGEVRSLAQRSADAAREIKVLIGTSVDKVAAGAGLVKQAGSTMGDIVTSVQRVTDVLGEITAAAEEQRDGIHQVNQAIGGLDQMTQQNAALVEESAAAADSLKSQAEQLAQAMLVFKLGGARSLSVPAPAPAPARRAAPARAPAMAAATAATPQAVAPAAKAAAQAIDKASHTSALGASAVPARAPAAGGAEGDWESF